MDAILLKRKSPLYLYLHVVAQPRLLPALPLGCYSKVPTATVATSERVGPKQTRPWARAKAEQTMQQQQAAVDICVGE